MQLDYADKPCDYLPAKERSYGKTSYELPHLQSYFVKCSTKYDGQINDTF
jgi:hypothetical protein